MRITLEILDKAIKFARKHGGAKGFYKINDKYCAYGCIGAVQKEGNHMPITDDEDDVNLTSFYAKYGKRISLVNDMDDPKIGDKRELARFKKAWLKNCSLATLQLFRKFLKKKLEKA